MEDDKARISQLETALREMHDAVHMGVYRCGGHPDIPGSSVIGSGVLGKINDIIKDALGRDDESLKYFDFPSD